VKQFLVEVFTPRAAAAALPAAERRATAAATRLSDSDVRFVRLTYIPDDQICFFVFDAPSVRDAALVAQHAGLDPIRVVEAVQCGEEKQ
jgi:hypothetical protein